MFDLSSLLPELLLQVFCALPSFSDVFVLATTCRALRVVWTEHTAIIWSRVAAGDVVYVSLARTLLADQGGAPAEAPTLSPDHVWRMVRNSRKAQKSAVRYGKEYAAKILTWGGYRYPPDNRRRHPPYLTLTEEPRFMRAYYMLWSLLELDAPDRQQRLKRLTVLESLQVAEMCHLPQPFGEEIGPDLKDVTHQSIYYYPVPLGRAGISSDLFDFAVERYNSLSGGNPPLGRYIRQKGFFSGPEDGYGSLGYIFDHCLEMLRADLGPALQEPSVDFEACLGT